MSELISNLNTIDAIKSSIKSAIEAKGVSMSGVSFPDYPSAIGSITTSFVTTTLSASVNGTFTPGQGVDGFSQVVVDVPQSVTGFTSREYIEGSVNLGNIIYDQSASMVGSAVFKRKTNITGVSLPNCTTVGNEAFRSCYYMTNISLPICTNLSDYAFANNTQALVNVELPECINVGPNCFENCTKLSTVSLPKCSEVKNNTFYQCINLNSLYIPLCSSIGLYAFYQCYGLTSVDFPNCSLISNSAFYQCIDLSTIVLSVCSSIGNYCFSGCSNLKTITLGSTSVCTAGFKIFNNVTGPISVYVPSSLVSEYKSATNWSQYASWIFPIPE